MTSFSSIAHSNLEICSPAPWGVYNDLLLAGTISDSPEILDIGCGKGGILAKAIELLGGRGTGVDLKNSLANEPTSAAQNLEDAGKLKFVFEDALLYLKNLDCTFDLIICVGSSHAVGGPEQLFNIARGHLRPKGKMLFAEIVWKSKPDQEFLKFLDCTEEDQLYSPQLRSLAQKNGLLVQQVISCAPEDFESYELSLRNRLIAWCQQNSEDPRASDFAKRSDSWWDAREKWARQAFGFEVMIAGLG